MTFQWTVPFMPASKGNLLELWLIGIIFSAMVYGGVLSLIISYIPLLLKSSQNISRRMRNFLLAYVMFMFAISTVHIIDIIMAVRNSIPFSDSYCHLSACMPASGIESLSQNGFESVLLIILASWGADAFMLWRCAVLYEGVSRPRRIALLGFLVILALLSASTSSALVLFSQSRLFAATITTSTIIVNLSTAALITFRILYFQKYIRKTVGLERNSPYMTIVIICVESSALIIVISSIYLLLLFLADGAMSVVPMQSLVHVYVISPLLIVYRVAQGRAATGVKAENEPVVSKIYFRSQARASISHGHEV